MVYYMCTAFFIGVRRMRSNGNGRELRLLRLRAPLVATISSATLFRGIIGQVSDESVSCVVSLKSARLAFLAFSKNAVALVRSTTGEPNYIEHEEVNCILQSSR